ncbi:nucleoside phosphorylase [Pantoea ananatis]|uniref:nucleoside phosphorylase n=1 Tax=Pantoea ananas TaxID=553 RepID=UPI00158CACA3|nr:nucleoside phosphorylase [Pantoea ananatis]MBA4823457.1 nucleoside phosphorylase [Pantoea ananatis]QKV88037.1 nucleoside phosphorylase [Pantoea ananatis]
MENYPIIDPNKFILYLRESGRLKVEKGPDTVLIVFLESIIEECKKKHELTKIEGFDAGELYVLEQNKNIGIFYCRGIGAPVATINLEELIAFGSKKIIVIGTAGTISKELAIADIVLCDSAISDEGTSRHYNLKDKITYPSKELTLKVSNSFKSSSLTFIEGKTWTTDAPYRETSDKVLMHQKTNVLCVEMEASALFTVSDFYKIDIAAAFVISDSLADLKWTPGFFSPHVMAKLLLMIESIFNCKDS